MALIESCTGISKSFGSRAALREYLARHLRGRAAGPDRTERLRQIDAAEDPLRPDSSPTPAPSRCGATRASATSRRTPSSRDGPDAPPKSSPRRSPDEHLDELERAARINQTLGRAGFTDGSAAHRIALRRLEAAPRHRARTGARSPTCCSSTSRPTTSISKASSGWNGCSSSAPLRQRRRQPRPLLPRQRGERHGRDRPRRTPRASSASRAATASSSRRRRSSCSAQSSRQESLANRVRREVEWLRRGPKARTGKSQGAHRRGRAPDPRAGGPGIAQRQRRRRRSISPPPTAAPSGWSRWRASRKEMGGRTLFRDLSFTLTPGTRLGLLGLNGTGQDHAAAHPQRRDRAGRRPRRDAPPPCASSTSTRRANSSIPRRRCARGSARTATR